MIALSPELPEYSERIRSEQGLTIPVLVDEANAVAREYGLVFELPEDLQRVYRGFGLDLPATSGPAGWTLPMPARYVVGRDGLVRNAQVHPDYTRRPEPEEALETVRALPV